MEGPDQSGNNMVSDSNRLQSVESDVNLKPTNKPSRKRKQKHGAVTTIRVVSISVRTQTEDTNPVPVLTQQTKPPLWELDTKLWIHQLGTKIRDLISTYLQLVKTYPWWHSWLTTLKFQDTK